MDIKLIDYVDSKGSRVLDFEAQLVYSGTGLPVRNGTWYLAEMSDPDRFSVAGSVLKVTDPIGVAASRILYLQTETLSRGSSVDVLFGEAERKQRAVVAALLQKGTIPTMPDTGNLTAELLTSQTSAAAYNSLVLQNLQDLAGTLEYRPSYTVVDDKLVMDIVEA